jgi:hypothetical protein
VESDHLVEARRRARGNCLYWAAKYLRMSRLSREGGNRRGAAELWNMSCDELRAARFYV